MENKGQCVKVDRKRWEEAQAWEQAFWVRAEKKRAKFGKNYMWRLLTLLRLKPKHRGDDSNLWWKQKFGEYAFIPEVLENVIELGCGPYTNMRLIHEGRTFRHMVLSDPLIRSYLKFPLCFVWDMYRRGGCLIDDHPIESCPFADDYFDLVVMNNVLDHVQDAQCCMEQAVRITKPGGILVIGQDLSNEEDMLNMRSDPGQTGHPIRVDHVWMDSYLTTFDPVCKKILSREEGRAPAHHYGTYLFAGKKVVS